MTEGDCSNKYEIFGLNNSDAECGDQSNLYFGYRGQQDDAAAVQADCRCNWSTTTSDESVSILGAVRLVVFPQNTASIAE
jgi:hypothetical protein